MRGAIPPTHHYRLHSVVLNEACGLMVVEVVEVIIIIIIVFVVLLNSRRL